MDPDVRRGSERDLEKQRKEDQTSDTIEKILRRRTLFLRIGFTAHQFLGRRAGGLDGFEELAFERKHAELDRHEPEIPAIGHDDALRFTTNGNNDWLGHFR